MQQTSKGKWLLCHVTAQPPLREIRDELRPSYCVRLKTAIHVSEIIADFPAPRKLYWNSNIFWNWKKIAKLALLAITGIPDWHPYASDFYIKALIFRIHSVWGSFGPSEFAHVPGRQCQLYTFPSPRHLRKAHPPMYRNKLLLGCSESTLSLMAMIKIDGEPLLP